MYRAEDEGGSASPWWLVILGSLAVLLWPARQILAHLGMAAGILGVMAHADRQRERQQELASRERLERIFAPYASRPQPPAVPYWQQAIPGAAPDRRV